MILAIADLGLKPTLVSSFFSLLLLLQASSLIFRSTSRWSGLAALATASTQTAKLLWHRRHVSLRASRGQCTRPPVNEKLSARKTVSVHQQKPFPPSHNMEWKPPVFYVLTLSLCFTNHQTLWVGWGGSTLWIGSGQTQQAKSKGLYSKLEMFPWGLCDFFFFPGAEGICEGMSVKMWASPQN